MLAFPFHLYALLTVENYFSPTAVFQSKLHIQMICARLFVDTNKNKNCPNQNYMLPTYISISCWLIVHVSQLFISCGMCPPLFVCAFIGFLNCSIPFQKLLHSTTNSISELYYLLGCWAVNQCVDKPGGYVLVFKQELPAELSMQAGYVFWILKLPAQRVKHEQHIGKRVTTLEAWEECWPWRNWGRAGGLDKGWVCFSLNCGELISNCTPTLVSPYLSPFSVLLVLFPASPLSLSSNYRGKGLGFICPRSLN